MAVANAPASWTAVGEGLGDTHRFGTKGKPRILNSHRQNISTTDAHRWTQIKVSTVGRRLGGTDEWMAGFNRQTPVGQMFAQQSTHPSIQPSSPYGDRPPSPEIPKSSRENAVRCQISAFAARFHRSLSNSDVRCQISPSAARFWRSLPDFTVRCQILTISVRKRRLLVIKSSKITVFEQNQRKGG